MARAIRARGEESRMRCGSGSGSWCWPTPRSRSGRSWRTLLSMPWRWAWISSMPKQVKLAKRACRLCVPSLTVLSTTQGVNMLYETLDDARRVADHVCLPATLSRASRRRRPSSPPHAIRARTRHRTGRQSQPGVDIGAAVHPDAHLVLEGDVTDLTRHFALRGSGRCGRNCGGPPAAVRTGRDV